MELNAVENEHLHLLKRRVHAAATLAQTTADCSTPLLLSQSLQARAPACNESVRVTLSLQLMQALPRRWPC